MSSSTQTNREVAVEIAVQPPRTVGVGRRLVPPVVARTSDPQLISDVLNNDKHVYATSMLTSSNGGDSSAALMGSWSVTAQLVTSSGGSGGSSRRSRSRWLYFVFDRLSIGVQGTYTISVVVSALSLTDGVSVVVGGRTTRQLTVVNQAAPPERPSSAERQVLRQLEEAGFYRP
ncbi:hypothetical protein VSDG_05900 [Cytospora chrysosperma]|uniref:Velvet domain-containing protein n=1 Tax=Cytospora chrysosperma TaxID=252740 RepID=A0A423VTT8_CYTCH|nr:hypothetical protein VSDG_05900 [Valsa sordida]